MPLYDFHCHDCDKTYEAIVAAGQFAPCPVCGLIAADRFFPMPGTYIWNCDAGGSTNPKRVRHQEERRKEGKRERIQKFHESGGKWGK